MVESYLRRSALAHKSLAARASESHPDAGVNLAEIPFRCMINLRGNPGDAAFSASAKQALGLDLPTTPNTVSASAGLTAFWLGPDEWLVVGAPGREGALAKELRDALAGQHFSVVDVTEARTVIAVSGRNAQDALQKGTPLDLHPKVFGAGSCAQTGLSKANVILHRLSDEQQFEIYVTISFADYLWNWLERACDEYGMAVVEPWR
jgi:sarcosine oxidase subunit gamma